MNSNIREIMPTDNYLLNTKKIINMIKSNNIRTSIIIKFQKEKQDSKNDYLKVISTCLGELLCAIPVILVEQLSFLEMNELLEKVHTKSQVIKDYNDVKRIVKYTIDNLKKQNDNDSKINETLNKLEFIKIHLAELVKLYNGSLKVLEKYVEDNLDLMGL